MASVDVVIYRKLKKAIEEFDLIKNGDKILIGLSGGKDSITLLYFLKYIQGKMFDFEIEALTVKNEINNINREFIKDFCNKNSVRWHIIENNIFSNNLFSNEELPEDCLFTTSKNDLTIDRQKKIRKRIKRRINCYICSRQRRTILLDYARKNSFNKIALAHHLDDIIETVIMNQFFYGRLQVMKPKFIYDKDGLELIRPFSFVRENDIIRFVTKEGFSSTVCNCNFDEKSYRKNVKEIIEFSSRYCKNIQENIFKSISFTDFI